MRFRDQKSSAENPLSQEMFRNKELLQGSYASCLIFFPDIFLQNEGIFLTAYQGDILLFVTS